ncbi:PREDICTED: transcription factor BIM2 isoform X2 [Ipomoea nil]|uniref:transcription factor BIM2 isoform X2 n=1 Tax=Ipomoea nil TaxID=35883 RepID=UPI000900E827|nr:PREDICTED: transcription factor BIM2 isoform X2 [Ipomoea nil]
MLRAAMNHSDEDDDMEFSSRSVDGFSQKVKVEGRSGDQKANVVRSKHSEAEQRRRSKINERFQILRNLIPEKDNKRDKASFLLEVIQYIQSLQGRIQMYEGGCQDWSQEPSELMPWRSSSGAVGHSELIRNGSAHEDNGVLDQTILANAHDSTESDPSAEVLYKTMDDLQRLTNEATSFGMQMQPSFFEGSIENLASQSQFFYWTDEQNETQRAAPGCSQNGQEEPETGGGEAGISNEFSQRLMNTLNRTLASLGVDMLQANVSVQLDIDKHTDTSSGANLTRLSSRTTWDHPHKKLRKEQS